MSLKPYLDTSTARLELLEELLYLWEPLYPSLADFLQALSGKGEGDFLEIGPFSGGVAKEMAKRGFKVAVLAQEEVLGVLKSYLAKGGRQTLFYQWQGGDLPLLDGCFDLVFCRGAFFFINEAFLREVERILSPGGMALIGGGYGPFAPEEVLKAIAWRSKELNLALGKRYLSPGELRAMLERAGLSKFKLIEEGGLWVLLQKEGKGESLGIKEALGLGPKEVISLVGGGGKTTLMFTLAKELAREGKKVLATTTTKIYEPSKEEVPGVLLGEDPQGLIEEVQKGLEERPWVVVAKKRTEEGKLLGIEPGLVERLFKLVDYVIVEADGSKGRPIKVHGESEPVVPECTTLFVVLVGADGISKPLSPDWIFRYEKAKEILAIGEGDRLTVENLLALFSSQRGLLKGKPPQARVVVFINKVDGPSELGLARELSQLLEKRGYRVVLGRAFFNKSVVELWGT